MWKIILPALVVIVLVARYLMICPLRAKTLKQFVLMLQANHCERVSAIVNETARHISGDIFALHRHTFSIILLSRTKSGRVVLYEEPVCKVDVIVHDIRGGDYTQAKKVGLLTIITAGARMHAIHEAIPDMQCVLVVDGDQIDVQRASVLFDKASAEGIHPLPVPA